MNNNVQSRVKRREKKNQIMDKTILKPDNNEAIEVYSEQPQLSKESYTTVLNSIRESDSPF